VILPKSQVCCGGLALHTGDEASARQMAAINIKAFQEEIDAVITNAAGCGSSLHDYPLLFKGSEWEAEAEELASRAIDISVFLANLGIKKPPSLPEPIIIAYHDACHLAHAQGITEEPRQILGQIPNASIVPINEGDLCCGSAGSYNIEQPDIAQKLGERKVNHILESGAQIVATGNIGCLVQIRKHLQKRIGDPKDRNGRIPVFHTIELLDMVYRSVNLL
jgi:glycolate oxidase iron-sulfur subunit